MIERDKHGFYAWCPELPGCQSEGATFEEASANIQEAVELYLETLPAVQRRSLLSSGILKRAVDSADPQD